MIIGIDGNEANEKQRVGIGQYAYQVISHLYLLHPDGVQFRIYLKESPIPDMPKETEWWKYEVFGPKRLWTQVGLPVHLFASAHKPDVIFSPSHYAPRFSPSPRAISVMDLSFLHFPDLFTMKDLQQLRSWTAYSVRKAKKIFTISEYSKQDIVSSYGIPADRVTVTYPGYDTEMFYSSPLLKGRLGGVDSNKLPLPPSLVKRGITQDYILFVGTVQPRKNIVRLIEAFENVKQKQPALQLVIAGKKGWLWEEIMKRMQTSPNARDIIHLDFVPEEDLPDLYGQARCFVLPSLFEGFGIPVVEAMACGTPVIVSNVSSLPEVVGDAGLCVDPYNTEDLALAILEAGYNERTWATLIARGLEQVKKFSWKVCAEKTLEILVESNG